jgi:hypothetical protein
MSRARQQAVKDELAAIDECRKIIAFRAQNVIQAAIEGQHGYAQASRETVREQLILMLRVLEKGKQSDI